MNREEKREGPREGQLRGSLVGLKVLDCSTVVAGGFASSMMADHGAEVIKIEQPGTGDPSRALVPMKGPVSLTHKQTGRNKKSITLKLSAVPAREIFKRLIRESDVLIENFRAQTLEKWGIGWKDLEAINPRLVMVRISGYGQTGPYSSRPGFGTVAEGLTGLPNRTGFPDGPPIFSPMPLADEIAGLFAAFSAMFALYNRDHGTGKGQEVDIGLYEPLFRMLEDQVQYFDQFGKMFERLGNRHAQGAPRGCFPTRDGKWVVQSAFSDSTVKRLLTVIGGPELANNPRYATNPQRVALNAELEVPIAKWISERTQAEVLEIFEKNDVVASSLFDMKDIFADPHFKAREDIVGVVDPDVGPIKVPGIVPKFSDTPGGIANLSVPLGYNNDEIYRGRLGMSEAEIAALKRDGLI